MKKIIFSLILISILLLPLAIAHEEGDNLTIEEHESEKKGSGCSPTTGCAADGSIEGFDISFLSPENFYVNEEVTLNLEIKTIEGEKYSTPIQVAIHEPGKEVANIYLLAKETEKGRYDFSWTPSFAGNYEIRYLFRNLEDDVVAPTYYIKVIDKRATNISYASIIFALIFLIYGIYSSIPKKKKDKFKISKLLTGIIIAAVIFGLGYSVSSFYNEGGEKGFTVCGPDGCDLAIHAHAELEMSVCGEEYDLGLEDGNLGQQHTHKEKNKLHFHSLIKSEKDTGKLLEPEKLFVGELFDQLEIQFTKECFGEYCNGDICPNGNAGELKMTVNGIPNEEYDEYVWNDGDTVKISFE